jgi:hypothetical protein
MKNIWTEKDIEAGLYIIRESSPKGSANLSFARTVVFKIGFSFSKGIPKYGKISCLTDGLFCPLGETTKDIADQLNADEIGYRPLTKEEYIKLIENTNQGFY